MKILIALTYYAEFGGLHDNVFATAIEAKSRGHEVYVACRSGAFNDKLSSNGIATVTINQETKVDAINRIIETVGTDIDLIHAHPGNSRIIALRLKKDFNIPVILHIHGLWMDKIENYINKLECVFTVSESVKQKVISMCNGYSEKIHVIPNYSEYTNQKKLSTDDDVRKITLISRLDNDKKLILGNFIKLIPYFNRSKSRLEINIIGDGKLKNEFVVKLMTEVKNELVNINFLGWVEDDLHLQKLMSSSNVVIGAGRVAIDSIAIGIPLIVSGSQSYQGVLCQDTWQGIIADNFGENGVYMSKTNITDDLDSILFNTQLIEQSVTLGNKISKTFFNKDVILHKHFNIYDIIFESNRR